jgi:hypothetical protein
MSLRQAPRPTQDAKILYDVRFSVPSGQAFAEYVATENYRDRMYPTAKPAHYYPVHEGCTQGAVSGALVRRTAGCRLLLKASLT